MNNVVTWEYYNSLYSKVTQDDFVSLVILAEKHVKLVVGHTRWSTINASAFYYDQLKDCICKVINKLADFNNAGAGKGLSSVSNDGYTENYVVHKPSEVEDEIRKCIIQWLSGTGLVGAFPLGG